jgi:hypothetical protein
VHSPNARPAWFTAICALPPFHVTLIAAARAVVVEFGATATDRVAVSLPEALLENVTQLAFDDAAHVQLPEIRVIVTLNAPPDAAGDWDVDETVYAHDGLGVVGALLLLHAAAPSAARSAHVRICFMT